MLYDEPFTGLDPISLTVSRDLIRDLNFGLGITSIIITHDVPETFAIADYVYVMWQGKIVSQGTPDELMESEQPLTRQFIKGETDGPPCPFTCPAAATPRTCGCKPTRRYGSACNEPRPPPAPGSKRRADRGDERQPPPDRAGRQHSPAGLDPEHEHLLRRAGVPVLHGHPGAHPAGAAPLRADLAPDLLRRHPVDDHHRRVGGVHRPGARAAVLHHSRPLRPGAGGGRGRGDHLVPRAGPGARGAAVHRLRLHRDDRRHRTKARHLADPGDGSDGPSIRSSAKSPPASGPG